MATKNIVPRETKDGGGIGRSNKVWSHGYFDDVQASTVNCDTSLDTNNLTATGSTSLKSTNISGNVTVSGGVNANSLSASGTVSAGSLSITNDATVNGTLTANEVSLSGNTGDALFWLNLKRLKSYSVGDIAFSNSTPNWVRLECVSGGTTSVVEPEGLSSVKSGDFITDGTVKWIVDDMRDGTLVGDVAFRPILRDGYLKLDGSTKQRSDYPRLVQYIEDNNLWTNNVANDPYKFGTGDGSYSFTVPNYMNLFIEGGDTPSKVNAGLPDIYGKFGCVTPTNHSKYIEGAFKEGDFGMSNDCKDIEAKYSTIYGYMFNASRSNPIYGNSDTVQPPAIKLIPQMKY